MSEHPDFREVVELVRTARYNLSHGNSYNELSRPIYEAAQALLDGTIATLEAIDGTKPA